MKNKLKIRQDCFFIIFALLATFTMLICMIMAKEIGYFFAFISTVSLTISEIIVKDTETEAIKLKKENERLNEENLKLKVLYYLKGGEDND